MCQSMYISLCPEFTNISSSLNKIRGVLSNGSYTWHQFWTKITLDTIDIFGHYFDPIHTNDCLFYHETVFTESCYWHIYCWWVESLHINTWLQRPFESTQREIKLYLVKTAGLPWINHISLVQNWLSNTKDKYIFQHPKLSLWDGGNVNRSCRTLIEY